MEIKKRQFDKQRGAALILVVVVTVLLAVIGVMFLMTSRVSEMETVAVTDQRDLKAAVQTVVSRIDEVLVKDLFGDDGQMVNADAMDESNDFIMGNYRLEPGLDLLWNTADDQHWYPGIDGVYDTPDDTYTLRAPDDNWLASLEPMVALDGFGVPVYFWPHITDLYDNNFGVPFVSLYYDPQNDTDTTDWDGSKPEFVVDAENVLVKVIGPKDRMEIIIGGAAGWNPGDVLPYGGRADADGDGVADSRWVKVPGLSTSRGKDVFTAVRIIDNGAMLNLNAAHCFYQGDYTDNTSFFEKPWYEDDVAAVAYYNPQVGTGRYLTEINYLPFLRGHDLNGNSYLGTASGDDWYNLMTAKGFWDNGTNLPLTPQETHNILMNIENAGDSYQFFDISDELELRNRYLVTSKVESRFEQDTVANYTLDAGGGTYGSLETPVDDTAAFDAWKIKVDPSNFDDWSGFLTVSNGAEPYRYDRRHVSTFYSYDRNLRKGEYPLLQIELAALGLTQQQIEAVEPVFMPLGAVTTNIENPDAAQPYNNIETRKRILHLLYALRGYYHQQNGGDLNAAALKATQIVANIIDFSDDDAPNTLPIPGATEGPFYEAAYGTQANVDCTFITEQVIQDMIAEVSGGLLPIGLMPFGLNATDIVFGYERQPFIAEIYAQWNGAPTPGNPYLEGFAIELINPYDQNINLTDWRLTIGSTVDYTFTSTDPILTANTRLVIRTTVDLGSGNTVPVEGGALFKDLSTLSSLEGIYPAGDFSLKLLRPAPSNSGISELFVDYISSDNTRSVLGTDGRFSLQRDDGDWKFIYGKYAPVITIAASPYNLGSDNSGTITDNGFQLAVPDDGNPLSRWHELETLSLYGNGADSSDPNDVITYNIANKTPTHFDLVTDPNISDYLCTINRPDEGTLPGRININTAPVHVIAAAIPPSLVTGSGFTALDYAQAIVSNRPYQSLGQLLTIPTGAGLPDVQWFLSTVGAAGTPGNAGDQGIDGDIEERDWILSNLANKFTVRSDVFTAYILVRLGENGPQRRMIAIFDRSGVWTPEDRPKLVALHPVPDPR